MLAAGAIARFRQTACVVHDLIRHACVGGNYGRQSSWEASRQACAAHSSSMYATATTHIDWPLAAGLTDCLSLKALARHAYMLVCITLDYFGEELACACSTAHTSMHPLHL